MKKLGFCFALVLGVFLVFGCGTLTGERRSPGGSGNSGSSSGSGSSGSSSGTGTSGSSGGSDISVSTQTESYIQDVLNLTNAFRTGNEAYYWNEDNTTKTNLVGRLGTLTLDADLCRAAQIRAGEIVESFSHTRPDGRNCGTVLEDLSIRWTRRGENIAAGYSGGNATFNQWKEDDKNYSGQGHRRNMLGDFTKIGLARAYDADSTYRYYWVMILTK